MVKLIVKLAVLFFSAVILITVMLYVRGKPVHEGGTFVPAYRGYIGRSETVGGYGYCGHWGKRDGDVELVHVLFIAKKQANGNPFSWSLSGSDDTWAFPSEAYSASDRCTQIEMFPQGIYVNRIRIPSDSSARVFVLRGDGVVVQVHVSSPEVEQLTPEIIRKSLLETSLWKDRIQPLLEPGK